MFWKRSKFVSQCNIARTAFVNKKLLSIFTAIIIIIIIIIVIIIIIIIINAIIVIIIITTVRCI